MDVVLFQVAEQIYAIHADTVREVVDPVPVTPLPFVPDSVEGLVNMSGRVLPQVSVAIRLGAGQALAAGDGTVLVLAVGDRLAACRVNKVVAKITIASEEISTSGEAEGGVDGPPRLLAGEFCWNDRQVVLLNGAGLMFDQDQHLAVEVQGEGLLAEASEDAGVSTTLSARDFPCVLFSSKGELFAFRFADVVEVVERGEVTSLPGAPAVMAGVQLLRGLPLPLVSMRFLLFGEMEEQAPYVLVVTIEGCPVGLQVEKVLGIQRFPQDALQPLLEEQSLLEGFLTTGDNRLVGVIRFSALADTRFFHAWKPFFVARERGDGAVVAGGEEAVRRMLLGAK